MSYANGTKRQKSPVSISGHGLKVSNKARQISRCAACTSTLNRRLLTMASVTVAKEQKLWQNIRTGHTRSEAGVVSPL